MNDESFDLGNGYRMVWQHDKSEACRRPTALTLFTFAIFGPDGKPANLEPYMGMGGHAEFIKLDGSVFAHVHPSGSVPMASVEVASPATMMGMHEGALGSSVSFPYGLPRRRYLPRVRADEARRQSRNRRLRNPVVQ